MPFIVGVPRSGTTLLRLMLDAHPELCIPSETHFLPGLLKLGGETASACEPFFRAVTEFETWDDFNLSVDEFARVLKTIDPFVISEGVRAFYRLYAARFGKKRWGDKTPPYSLFLREVESILPEAPFYSFDSGWERCCLVCEKTVVRAGPGYLSHRERLVLPHSGGQRSR